MYIHMISTICAVSEIGKKCHVYADEFANHWEFVPYAGGFIAALGIPLIIIISRAAAVLSSRVSRWLVVGLYLDWWAQRRRGTLVQGIEFVIP